MTDLSRYTTTNELRWLDQVGKRTLQQKKVHIDTHETIWVTVPLYDPN